MHQRREVLETIFKLAAIASAIPLAACGGGSDGANGASPASANANPPSPLPIGTQSVTGTVNLSEIGGTSLRVQSVYWQDSPVTAGTFRSVTSTQGAQLLLLADHSSGIAVLRGMAVSLPTTALMFGADSTALALVMLTMGILTVDVTEANSRIAVIRGLPSLKAFSTYLASQLPNLDLTNLAKNATFLTLRQKTTDDFFASFPNVKPASFQSGGVDALFTVSKNQGDPSQITLSNTAHRFVSVIRQTLDLNRSEVGKPVTPKLSGAQNPFSATNLISGANLLSWGNILVPNQAGQPGTATDSIDPSLLLGVSYLDYWIDGLGIPGGPQLPSSIQPDAFARKSAALGTIFFYFMGPVLDFLGGSAGALKYVSGSAPKGLADFVSSLAGLNLNIGGLDSALASASGSNTAAAIIDVELAVLGLGKLLVLALVAAGAVTEGAPLAAAFLFLAGAAALATAVFGLANIAGAVASLVTHPNVGKAEVPTAFGKYVLRALSPTEIYFGSINQAGDVLGSDGTIINLITNSGPKQGVVQTLVVAVDPLNKAITALSNLNELGHFAYAIGTGVGDFTTGYLYQGTTSTDLGQIGGRTIRPSAIDNLDVVAGTATTDPAYASLNYDVFEWTAKDGIKDLGIGQGRNSLLAVRNNAGQILYISGGEVPSAGISMTLLEKIGNTTSLTVIESFPAVAPGHLQNSGIGLAALNDKGDVAYTKSTSSLPKVFLWSKGTSTQLPSLPNSAGGDFALGINNLGQVIGISGDVPVIWSKGTVTPLLDLLIPPLDVKTVYLKPFGINDKGQIVAVLSTVGNVPGPNDGTVRLDPVGFTSPAG